jgi:short-subunit dehydrogenase
VVMSSLSSVLPLPLRSSYVASKYAVNGFFGSLFYEVGDKITITMIITTTFTGSNFRKNSLSGSPPEATKRTNYLSLETVV